MLLQRRRLRRAASTPGMVCPEAGLDRLLEGREKNGSSRGSARTGSRDPRRAATSPIPRQRSCTRARRDGTSASRDRVLQGVFFNGARGHLCGGGGSCGSWRSAHPSFPFDGPRAGPREWAVSAPTSSKSFSRAARSSRASENFALLHALADVPVDEGALGVHEVELVVDALASAMAVCWRPCTPRA